MDANKRVRLFYRRAPVLVVPSRLYYNATNMVHVQFVHEGNDDNAVVHLEARPAQPSNRTVCPTVRRSTRVDAGRTAMLEFVPECYAQSHKYEVVLTREGGRQRALKCE